MATGWVKKETSPIYQAIGDFFKKRCSGYWGYVFTGNRSLGKRIGLKTSRKIEFYNGPIECRLFEYELYSGSRNSSWGGLDGILLGLPRSLYQLK